MSMVGKTLAHYEITSQLGKGGMGEVYQAKDRKLGRDVAIKVLPEEFAKDADRVARFQREAKLLASLNHPNIAAIYGLEASEQTNFLVLELVEGETLADQIRRGPIPVEETLKLALQIAEALEVAHEKGVIHRDLKPANIKVTPDGKVKVLDFGLAKAFAGEQAEMNLSNSPTLSNAATQQGVILGTAAYMSPEQAKGKAVDKRTDIWAFGCVLYEMLTGQAAFQGEDVTEILASVVKGGVNFDLLPANLHFRVREVITRCLQKDLNNRYSGITDARYEIGQALADPSGLLMPQVTAIKPRKQLRLSLPWVAAIAILCLVIAGVVGWKYKPMEPRQILRTEYSLPKDQQLGNPTHRNFSASPDGKQFVYSTAKGLYLRSLDEFDAKLIVGTETNPINPFFSADGKWIGYFSSADQKLKKIAASGGAPATLCDISGIVLGANWGSDDIIVYADYPEGIKRVSANGGTPEVIVKGAVYCPQLLPDGKSVLFQTPAPYKIFVQSLQSGERKELFAGEGPQYISTGHILYTIGNNLLAVPFDLKTLKVTGGPVSVVEGIWRLSADFAPQYAVSDSGMLVYMPGTIFATAQRTLVWIDRKGKEVPIAATPNSYSDSTISPDGTKVALTITSSSPKSDIWIYDFVRETMTRLTFNETSFAPNWTPDGKRIVFASGSTATKWAVYWKAADGTGGDEILIPEINESGFAPSSWSRDGKTLLLFEDESGTKPACIFALPLDGDRKVKTLLQDKFTGFDPKISPDGRWMAYGSDESGKPEIYVRPFPDVNNGKWQISSSAHYFAPLWSPNGRELFYISGDSIMAVAIEAGPAFKYGKPEKIFQGNYFYDWSISHDGNRFLVMKEVGSNASEEGGPRKINIVLNWLEELKQRVPVK